MWLAALTAADAVDGNPYSQDAQVGLFLHPGRQSAVSDLRGRPPQAKDWGVPQDLGVRQVDGAVLGHGCFQNADEKRAGVTRLLLACLESVYMDVDHPPMDLVAESCHLNTDDLPPSLWCFSETLWP